MTGGDLVVLASGSAGWTAVGHPTDGVWAVLGLAGPLLLATVLLFLLARALLRHGRYRVVNVFDESDRARVREAVIQAEVHTVGEILPVIVERSDEHPAAEWRAAVCFSLAGSALLATWIPWHYPALVLTAQLLMGAVGFFLARALPALKRSFIRAGRAGAVAEEQAFQEFYANGLHRTRAQTGVLLFVSLLEQRVVVLADSGIDSKVDAGFWTRVDEAVLEGIRTTSLADGLVEGIRRAGELLAERFPAGERDPNEVPDRVIVRAE